ncbi:hypothetical protein Tco_0693290, partial [Tanacetum coccineum]
WLVSGVHGDYQAYGLWFPNTGEKKHSEKRKGSVGMDDLEHKWNEIVDDGDEEDEEITEYEYEKEKKEGNACPHSKTICSSKDVKLLYVPRLCTVAHQKASSTRYFPFTKGGFYEFNAYEWLRQADAKKLQSYALKQLTDIKRHHLKVTTHTELLSKWAAEWAHDDAHARLASAYANELGSRGRRVHVVARLARACELEANKLAQLADALRRWADSLERVTDAYTTRLDFF